MRTFLKIIVCLSTLLLISVMPAYSAKKSDKLKPKWVTQAVPQNKTDTYIFVRAHGQGKSLSEARQAAFVAMAQRLEAERGLTINTNIRTTETFSQKQSSNETEYRQEITLDVTEKGRQMKIVCREIDDFWTERKGMYDIDVLYTVTDQSIYGGSYNDDIKITSRYGARGLLSIIPGVGQFHKGSITKGSLILAGEIAAAGGIILCENTRASYIKKMQEQPKYASEYNSLADSWETGRNICIGAAAAIYIYNLIDALTANGAKRVIVKTGKAQFSLAPHADCQSIGLGIALKF